MLLLSFLFLARLILDLYFFILNTFLNSEILVKLEISSLLQISFAFKSFFRNL